jgi:hypothetical protein
MRRPNRIRIAGVAEASAKTPLAVTSAVDHRDGSGHLDPEYRAHLSERASEHVRKARDRAFVSGSWSADLTAEESAEEFVMTVTSGEDGGESMLDAVTPEERGGPFVETAAATEFAYDVDASNPADGTREPFPTS